MIFHLDSLFRPPELAALQEVLNDPELFEDGRLAGAGAQKQLAGPRRTRRQGRARED